jgi:vacuolar-type H+-ATPase subunit B/Vma2
MLSNISFYGDGENFKVIFTISSISTKTIVDCQSHFEMLIDIEKGVLFLHYHSDFRVQTISNKLTNVKVTQFHLSLAAEILVLVEYTLSRKYRENINNTQTVCYSFKFILSLSKYAPSETICK